MEILINGKHFDVSERVEDRAQDKLQHLEHFLPLLSDGICHVDLAYEKSKEPERRFIVHINVKAHGVHLQATGHADQPETAIDHAAQVLVRQARRQKDRIYSHGRQNEEMPPPRVDTEVVSGVPARVKRFDMKPMTVVEAMEQIEALGHNFYVFRHAEEERIAVLYRRNSGGYGLILPEVP